MSKRLSPDDEFPAAPKPPGRIVCGYCSNRWSGVVDPDCPICGGAGYLLLGRACVGRYGHAVTALAVEYGLEAAARRTLSRQTPAPAAARSAIGAAVATMQRAGILAAPERPRAAAAAVPADADWIGDGRPRRGTAYPLSFGICDLRPAAATIPGPDTAPPPPARRRGRRGSKRRRPGGR